MDRMASKVSLLLALVFLGAIAYYYALLPRHEVILEFPRKDEVTASPMIVAGTAPGNWFNAGAIMAVLKDGNGEVLATEKLQASEVTTSSRPVRFEGRIYFFKPATPDGILVLEKWNGFGLQNNEHSASFRIRFVR
jgi:hypothetical protein